jgi:glycosyltransferase involved in cell wall biosynthesis
VIASDRVASAFDLIVDGESGFLVDSSDLQRGLESALRVFCEDPTAAARFGERSRRRYEEFVDPLTNVASLDALLRRARERA